MPRSDFLRNFAVAAALSAMLAVAVQAQDAAAPEPAAPETNAGAAPDAAPSEAMPTAMLNDGWAEATLAKIDRDGDKMTVRVRFKKAEDAEGTSAILYGTLSEAIWERDIYITAGDKKYLLLVDSNDVPLASSELSLSDDGPQAGAWYGTFPAPPAGESATLQLPKMEPLGPFTVPE